MRRISAERLNSRVPDFRESMTVDEDDGERESSTGAAKGGITGITFAVAWKRSRHGLSEMARAQWISRCVSYGRSLSLPFAPLFLALSRPRFSPAQTAVFPASRSLLPPSRSTSSSSALYACRFGMLVLLIDKSPVRNCFRSSVLVSFNSAEKK